MPSPWCPTLAIMSHEYRYVTYKMDGGKLKTDKKGPVDATYQNFLADLKVKDDCRYALVDFSFSVNSQGKKRAIHYYLDLLGHLVP